MENGRRFYAAFRSMIRSVHMSDACAAAVLRSVFVRLDNQGTVL